MCGAVCHWHFIKCLNGYHKLIIFSELQYECEKSPSTPPPPPLPPVGGLDGRRWSSPRLTPAVASATSSGRTGGTVVVVVVLVVGLGLVLGAWHHHHPGTTRSFPKGART